MKNKFKALGLLVLVVGLMVGCGKSSSLEVSGSTSVAPVMEELTKAYTEKTKVEINVNADGSSAGVKAASEGISNIGMVSRELKPEEEKLGLKTEVIALDAIAVVVNPKNPIKNLTLQQITDIYSGKITNWKQLGQADLPIVVVSREEGSGTRGAFEELASLLNEDDSSKVDAAKPVIGSSTGAIIENVKQKEGAIGYVSLGSIDESLKAVSVDKVSPTEASVKDKTYVLSRNFNIVSKDANEETTKLIEWILSAEGQKIVVDKGYISVK